MFVIGTGQSGVLPISEKTQVWLDEVITENNIEVIKGTTPKILEKTNTALNSGKKVVGIFHTTC